MQDDPQDPDDSDIDDDGEDFATTEPCPSCGNPVYEDAEICPKCGQYISQEDSTKPLWIIVTTGVCVAVILIVWVLLRM
jgi:predicted nucleic acid-binding Zn ribbon protein